jgi:hypothetical protein
LRAKEPATAPPALPNPITPTASTISISAVRFLVDHGPSPLSKPCAAQDRCIAVECG